MILLRLLTLSSRLTSSRFGVIHASRWFGRRRRLASLAMAGTVRLWDVALRQEVWSAPTIHGSGERARIVFRPDGQALLVALNEAQLIDDSPLP